jgi:hypothetical protein
LLHGTAVAGTNEHGIAAGIGALRIAHQRAGAGGKERQEEADINDETKIETEVKLDKVPGSVEWEGSIYWFHDCSFENDKINAAAASCCNNNPIWQWLNILPRCFNEAFLLLLK